MKSGHFWVSVNWSWFAVKIDWFVYENGIYSDSQFLPVVDDIIFESIIWISSFDYEHRTGTSVDSLHTRNIVRFFSVQQPIKNVSDYIKSTVPKNASDLPLKSITWSPKRLNPSLVYVNEALIKRYITLCKLCMRTLSLSETFATPLFFCLRYSLRLEINKPYTLFPQDPTLHSSSPYESSYCTCW